MRQPVVIRIGLLALLPLSYWITVWPLGVVLANRAFQEYAGAMMTILRALKYLIGMRECHGGQP
jgi:hypothetical protein